MRSLLAVAVVLLTGCSDGGSERTAATSAAATTSATAAATESRAPGFDQELHDELIGMLERDQSGRTGGPDAEGDAARTERLAEILAEHGHELDAVVQLVVPDDVVVGRMLSRGRSDDTEDVIRNRLKVYQDETAPLLDHYRGRLVQVDGVGEVEEVTARVTDALKAR